VLYPLNHSLKLQLATAPKGVQLFMLFRLRLLEHKMGATKKILQAPSMDKTYKLTSMKKIEQLHDSVFAGFDKDKVYGTYDALSTLVGVKQARVLGERHGFQIRG
jgi:hypothetical protein